MGNIRSIHNKGFTIIEMLVAVALFTVVAVVSVGTILSIVDANQKARSLKSVMENLHFALQGMTFGLQVGRDYNCTPTIGSGNCDGGTRLEYRSAVNDLVTYRYNTVNKSIERRVGSGLWLRITAPEVVIDDFKFYVVGASETDTRQPLVIMTVKGTAGVSGKTQTSFFVQTATSQRRLDN